MGPGAAQSAAAGCHGARSIRLLYTEPQNAQIYKAQLEAIRRAQSYVYVQNAYLSDDRILYELVSARMRGVDVRVVLPASSDSNAMQSSNLVAANLLRKYGVKVYRYPGMTHIKAAIVDGWVCVGSANFDKLSLRLNRELNIASSDPEFARQVREQLFEVDFARSELLDTAQEVALRDQVFERLADLLL